MQPFCENIKQALQNAHSEFDRVNGYRTGKLTAVDRLHVERHVVVHGFYEGILPDCAETTIARFRAAYPVFCNDENVRVALTKMAHIWRREKARQLLREDVKKRFRVWASGWFRQADCSCGEILEIHAKARSLEAAQEAVLEVVRAADRLAHKIERVRACLRELHSIYCWPKAPIEPPPEIAAAIASAAVAPKGTVDENGVPVVHADLLPNIRFREVAYLIPAAPAPEEQQAA